MIERNDWRLHGQENYLKGAKLVWKRYTRYSADWDHDHCQFCMAKFMDIDTPEVLREGYATLDNYSWICKRCYEDFKQMFAWQVDSGAEKV